MKQYELTYLARTEENQADGAELINHLGGKIIGESTLGRRKLTYPIKNESSAAYFTYQFELDSEKLAELNQKLTRNQNILRYLLIAGIIRKSEEIAPDRRQKGKEIEVPESLTKGIEELKQIEEQKIGETTEGGAKVKEEKTESESEAVEKKIEEKEETVRSKATEEKAADVLTAEERQKKLDEKLKSILGE